MKFSLSLLAVLFVGVYAANPLGNLIKHEVDAIMAANPDLTVDHCSTKCDALFSLIAGHDEKITDRMCKTTCQCKIDPITCHATSMPSHHTHAPKTTTTMPRTTTPMRTTRTFFPTLGK